MHEETLAIWGLGPFWVIVSIVILALARWKVKREFWKCFMYAIGGSHLLAPTLIGGWNWSFPLPATYAIYGYIISIPAGEFFFFRAKDAMDGIVLATVLWSATFLGFWFSLVIVRNTKSEPG